MYMNGRSTFGVPKWQLWLPTGNQQSCFLLQITVDTVVMSLCITKWLVLKILNKNKMTYASMPFTLFIQMIYHSNMWERWDNSHSGTTS